MSLTELHEYLDTAQTALNTRDFRTAQTSLLEAITLADALELGEQFVGKIARCMTNAHDTNTPEELSQLKQSLPAVEMA